MDIVNLLKAFVGTAQTGSFTAAADQMGISNRLTSKYVAELEARLGVRLFQRTTRKVGLTPAGQDLLVRAPAVIDAVDELISDVTEGSRGFSGMIRIAAPLNFGESYISAMLGRFGALHPALSFDVRLSDKFVDLAQDGIDVAFRIGKTQNLSVKTKKLAMTTVFTAASPSYLAKHGVPRIPSDLTKHHCIIDTNTRAPMDWRFSKDGQELKETVSGRFMVNSAQAACALAVAGEGIVYGPKFALRAAIDAGLLVPVLTAYEGGRTPISAVYLEGRALTRKVRALIDFAQADIRSSGML